MPDTIPTFEEWAERPCPRGAANKEEWLTMKHGFIACRALALEREKKTEAKWVTTCEALSHNSTKRLAEIERLRGQFNLQCVEYCTWCDEGTPQQDGDSMAYRLVCIARGALAEKPK